MKALPIAVPISEEHLMLQEMTHRVSNEFASAIGFVSVKAARSSNTEVKAALSDVAEQLHNYARVHKVLQAPVHEGQVDAALFVRDLCQSISRSKLQPKGIELVLVEHPIQLNAEQCWKLGMIVSELITNAYRHAFGERSGLIRIELAIRGAFVECSVADNGSSPKPIKPGHGMKIIQSLVRSLNGEVEQHFGPGGAISILKFPYSSKSKRRKVRDDGALNSKTAVGKR